jgi:SAM-dependent methyltransferase
MTGGNRIISRIIKFVLSLTIAILSSPIFWGGAFVGYYSMYGMGHLQHGWFWVALGIVPIIGLIYSLSPLVTRDIFNRRYANSMGLEGPERVIEFGCGSGRLSQYLAPLVSGGHLTCIDIDAHAIGEARNRLQRFTNVDFILDDIRKIPPPTELYDVAVIQFVLHDILSHDRIAIIEALARWLTNRGVLHIREPKEFVVLDDIQRLMKQAGFTEVESKSVRPSFMGVYYGSRDIYQSRYILNKSDNEVAREPT